MKQKLEELKNALESVEEIANDLEEQIKENLVPCVTCEYCSIDSSDRLRCAKKHIDVGFDQACLKGWPYVDTFCENCVIE